MQKPLSINELYSQYREGSLGKRQFEGLLFEVILENFGCYNLFGWERDECIDYLTWFYPRLSRAVDSYQDTGASFESYISSMVRWSTREYYSRTSNRYAAEHAAWAARMPDMYVHTNEPEYSEMEETPESIFNGKLKTVRNPRQLLILCLKCYYYLSDDLLERFASLIGIEKAQLKHMVDTIRILRIKRDEETRLMRERIHTQFYRCIIYEKRLKTLHENSNAYIRQKIKLEKARQRLETMKKRLASIRPEATNTQIAGILGIPKGTVDSNLHALRTRLKKAGKDALENF